MSSSVSSFRRTFVRYASTKHQSSKNMTSAERDSALRAANEKMRAYYQNPPPARNKKRSSQQDKEHQMQAALVSSFLVAFISAAMLGKKIAQDDAFRQKWVPAWYDFSIEKPAHAWTRDELHEQMVEVQRELHERAIRGEFTREKLEEMRRHAYGVVPADDEHGWGKLHPGVDDDEEIEEED